MHRILVCGSRKYVDSLTINRVLDAQLAKHGGSLILITGGAVGADEIARKWAVSRKVDHVIRYAKWELEGKGAGPIRNARMLKHKPHKVFAFKIRENGENRGTDNMIAQASRAKVKVKVFY